MGHRFGLGRCNVSFTGDCSGDVVWFQRPVDGNVYGYCEHHVDMGVHEDRRDIPESYRLVRVKGLLLSLFNEV